MDDIYHQLARHVEKMVMGLPYSEALLELLSTAYSREQAAVLIGIPNNLDPLETAPVSEIARNLSRGEDETGKVLAGLAERNLVFSGPTRDGSRGYALLQAGFGLPQVFFWGGQSEAARKIAGHVYRYFNPKVTHEVFGKAETKSYRYIPVEKSIAAPGQSVLPCHSMEDVINATQKIGLAHCSCRVGALVAGRTDCNHSLEVCFKYDEMADFVIHQGLARPLSKDEAIHLLGKCEDEGLVHMVDNTQNGIKHTCNCCGHYCWNVGMIRRRKVARDMLMSVHFSRITDLEECIGCGACEEICPVDAVVMREDEPQVDLNWCIGCGVCAKACPTQAIDMVPRGLKAPPETFEDMCRKIQESRAG